MKSKKPSIPDVIIVSILLLCCCSCDLSRKRTYKNTEIAPSLRFLAYNFDHPTHKYFLGADLEEISGLSYYTDKHLACVQDELGKVFIYNLERKKITKRMRFGKEGDYEGVEVVNGMIYVVHSKGTLYRFKPASSDDIKVDEIKLDIPGEVDIEGLGYDPQRKSLLLAVKNQSVPGIKNSQEKAIYAFNLDSNQVNPTPAWVIRKDSLENFLTKYDAAEVEEDDDDEDDKEEKKGAKKKEKIEKDDLVFKPSGIAVHPKTGDLYIIASEGKWLLVINRKGDIVTAIKLTPRMLKQPEGICFAPNGDLFIASEGREGDGFILKFAYQPKQSATKN